MQQLRLGQSAHLQGDGIFILSPTGPGWQLQGFFSNHGQPYPALHTTRRTNWAFKAVEAGSISGMLPRGEYCPALATQAWAFFRSYAQFGPKQA